MRYGGVATLHPEPTEGPMTEERMALAVLLQKSGDGDFLRSVAEAVLQILMETDVEGLIGAGRHERTGVVAAGSGTIDTTGLTGPVTESIFSELDADQTILSFGTGPLDAYRDNMDATGGAHEGRGRARCAPQRARARAPGGTDAGW